MMAPTVQRLRRAALHALAVQNGMDHAPDWLDRALRKRLPQAAAFLRKASRANRLHRWFLKRWG